MPCANRMPLFAPVTTATRPSCEEMSAVLHFVMCFAKGEVQSYR